MGSLILYGGCLHNVSIHSCHHRHDWQLKKRVSLFLGQSSAQHVHHLNYMYCDAFFVLNSTTASSLLLPCTPPIVTSTISIAPLWTAVKPFVKLHRQI